MRGVLWGQGINTRKRKQEIIETGSDRYANTKSTWIQLQIHITQKLWVDEGQHIPIVARSELDFFLYPASLDKMTDPAFSQYIMTGGLELWLLNSAWNFPSKRVQMSVSFSLYRMKNEPTTSAPCVLLDFVFSLRRPKSPASQHDL